MCAVLFQDDCSRLGEPANECKWYTRLGPPPPPSSSSYHIITSHRIASHPITSLTSVFFHLKLCFSLTHLIKLSSPPFDSLSHSPLSPLPLLFLPFPLKRSPVSHDDFDCNSLLSSFPFLFPFSPFPQYLLISLDANSLTLAIVKHTRFLLKSFSLHRQHLLPPCLPFQKAFLISSPQQRNSRPIPLTPSSQRWPSRATVGNKEPYR